MDKFRDNLGDVLHHIGTTLEPLNNQIIEERWDNLADVIRDKLRTTLGPLSNQIIIDFEVIKSNLEEDDRDDIEVTTNNWKLNMAVHQVNKVLYKNRFTATELNEMVDLLLFVYEEEDNEDEIWNMFKIDIQTFLKVAQRKSQYFEVELFCMVINGILSYIQKLDPLEN